MKKRDKIINIWDGGQKLKWLYGTTRSRTGSHSRCDWSAIHFVSLPLSICLSLRINFTDVTVWNTGCLQITLIHSHKYCPLFRSCSRKRKRETQADSFAFFPPWVFRSFIYSWLSCQTRLPSTCNTGLGSLVRLLGFWPTRDPCADWPESTGVKRTSVSVVGDPDRCVTLQAKSYGAKKYHQANIGVFALSHQVSWPALLSLGFHSCAH